MGFGVNDLLAVLDEVQPVIERRFGARIERMVGARVDSGDLFQSVSLKAIRGVSRFDGTDRRELRHWVLQIAKNTYQSYLWTNLDCRKRSVAFEGPVIGLATDDDPGYQPACNTVEPSSRLELSEQCDAVLAHVDGLPLRQADALRMRFISGLEYEQIAVSLGCTIGAARKLVSRGISSIRSEVAGLPVSHRPRSEPKVEVEVKWVQLRFFFD